MARAATPTPTVDDQIRAKAAAPERAADVAAPDERELGGDVVASTREAVLAAAPLQAKLVVGAVNDPLEAEADRMADAVVARIAAAPGDVARSAVEEEEPLQGSRVATRAAVEEEEPLQGSRVASRAGVEDEEPLQGSRVAARAAVEEEEPLQGSRTATRAAIEEEEPLQGSRTASAAGPEGGAVDDDLEARLRGGSGAPLGADVRGAMEQAFGADFSAVRVAETPAALEIGARAYATGTDIRFAPGQYRPDTASGQHLLAHELAHVVQQGGAGALHRDRSEAAGELFEATTTATADAEAVAGTVDDIGGLGEAVDLDAHGTAGDLGVTGLAAGITGLISGFMNVYARMQDGSTEDKLVAAHETLESAGGVVKGAIDVATAAGASVVGTVVPGLDLAFSLLSAVRNVGHLVYLVQAKNLQGAQLDDLAKSMDGTDAKKDAENNKLAHALGNIQSHTKQRIASTAINLGGDITMAVGAAAQLATGPFGTAVKLAGGLVKLSVSIGSVLMQSYEAGKTSDARAEFDAAAKSGDATRKEKATVNRLDNDAAFALTEIITRASYSTDPGADGAFDKRMLAILATYGIGAAWLEGWVDGGRDPKKREEAEDRALRFIGAERDPKTIGQRIKNTLSSIWNFVTGDSKEKTPVDPAVIRKDAMQSAMSANSLKPIVYATPAQVTQFFFSPVVDHLQQKYNPDNDKSLKGTIMLAIDEGLAAALDSIINWIVPGTLHVVNGDVSFEDAI